MNDTDGLFFVPADDPVVIEATAAVQRGDLGRLDVLIAEFPCLPTARFGDPRCHRTLLHAATDWPGSVPHGPDVVQRLVRAGADVNAHSRFESHTETPLHWAASSDDVAVLDALLDAGADIESPWRGAGRRESTGGGVRVWELDCRRPPRGTRGTHPTTRRRGARSDGPH